MYGVFYSTSGVVFFNLFDFIFVFNLTPRINLFWYLDFCIWHHKKYSIKNTWYRQHYPMWILFSSFGSNNTTETTEQRASAGADPYQVVRTAHITSKAIYPLEGTTIRWVGNWWGKHSSRTRTQRRREAIYDSATLGNLWIAVHYYHYLSLHPYYKDWVIVIQQEEGEPL